MKLRESSRDLIEKLEARANTLEAQLQDKQLESSALRQIGQAMGMLFDIDEMLKKVAEIIVRVTGTDLCLIFLLDQAKTNLVLRASSGPSSGITGKIKLKVGEGVTGWVAKERRLVALDREAWLDARFKPVPEFQQDTYQSMLSLPLPGKEDLVGVINVSTDPPHEYTATQISLLSSIAEQVGGAVENFLQYQKVEKQASHLTTLSQISHTVTSDLYLEEVLNLIVAMTAESMNFRICTLMLLDEQKQELIIKASQTKSENYLKKPNIKFGESVAGRAVAEGKPISVLDVRKTSQYRYPDVAKREGLCSLISVPLKLKGKTIGVLNGYTAKPHVFTDEEIGLLSALGSHAAMAIENAKLKVRSAVIQEMHHRVKNSLQTIASLLRLQIRYGKFDSVEQVLNECINRILAIASVHELLSGDNLDIVNVKKVATGIMGATTGSLVPPDKSLETVIEGKDIMLPARKATSVALILNELVQNAIEHGFRVANRGKIVLSLSEYRGKVRMAVSNDGEPLPREFDLHSHQNLGLQIVETLVRDDLTGDFTLTNQRGYIKALVTFPK